MATITNLSLPVGTPMEITIRTRPCKVLIVEDLEDIRAMLKEMVILLGYQTITANDGLEAITVAQDQLPDLILMDVWLPKKNGTAAAREIRAIPACAHIPIIRLSALDEPINSQGEPEHFEWDAYITKPIDLSLLESTMRDLLEKLSAHR